MVKTTSVLDTDLKDFVFRNALEPASAESRIYYMLGIMAADSESDSELAEKLATLLAYLMNIHHIPFIQELDKIVHKGLLSSQVIQTHMRLAARGESVYLEPVSYTHLTLPTKA